MTKTRRLVPLSEVTGLLDALKKYGITPHSIDIRSDGVTVTQAPSELSPGQYQDNPDPTPGSAYDDWKKEDNRK